MPSSHPIAAVARMTGLSIDTLRAWERRYGLVRPARDEAGVRRYSERDVARLELARAATALGHPIRWVAKLSDDELRGVVRAAPAPATSEPAEPTVRAVLEQLGRYDVAQAERTLNAAALLMPVEEFLVCVIAPLMRRVGALWEAGRLSVAQEHLVSHLVRNLLGRLATTRAEGERCALLLATPTGELHEFGIALAGSLAGMRGLRSTLLGPSVPADDVVAAARVLQPRTVVLGTSASLDPELLSRYLRALDARLPARTELWVGGDGGAEPRDWPKRARHVATLDEFLRLIAARQSVAS